MNAPEPRTGVLALLDAPPPRDWPQVRWSDFVADAVQFRRQWGAVSHQHGWTPLELFGMSRAKPFALHAWGAIPFVNGAKVVEVLPDRIVIETRTLPDKVDPKTGEILEEERGNRLVIRKRPPCHDAALAWDLTE